MPSGMDGMSKADIERFWSRVDQSHGANACWPWMRRRNDKGYGQFDVLRRPQFTHRISFVLTHGHYPENLVLHTCDNPPCCNPAHLYDGTQKQNVADRENRHRRDVRGEVHPNAKLTDLQADTIRALYATGRYKQDDLARQFKVHRGTISSVVTGRRKVGKYSHSIQRNASQT